jgi:multicomponent Na+:H+ antiporter subunit B
MKARERRFLILLGAAGIAVALTIGFLGLPAFGKYPGPYGDMINSLAPYQRHVTNAIAAVNFDYRGLDTLGEEFILFASVCGLVLLLRGSRGEKAISPVDTPSDRNLVPRSEAIHWLGYGLIGLVNLFGFYVVLHGHLTPGGGFQGGAILGTASLLVYLAVDYRAYCKTGPKPLLEIAESLGTGAYLLLGLGGILTGGAFLHNFLPLGQRGDLFSGGTILAINCAVGLEVAAGFALLFREFLEETRAPEEGEE